MTVSVIVIAHNDIASALVHATTSTFGELPLPTTTVAVNQDSDPDDLIPKLRRLTETVDEGDGVLLLTDLFGSTPNNIARELSKTDKVAIVSGLNLPMLVRVMNYPKLSLEELAKKAISGGKEGVMDCRPDQLKD